MRQIKSKRHTFDGKKCHWCLLTGCAFMAEVLLCLPRMWETIGEGISKSNDWPAMQMMCIEGCLWLLSRGRHEDAIASYRAATSLVDGNAQAFLRLGNSLFSLERFAEAEVAFKRALKVRMEDRLFVQNRFTQQVCQPDGSATSLFVYDSKWICLPLNTGLNKFSVLHRLHFYLGRLSWS